MTRLSALALAAAFTLGACASTAATHYSHVPPTEVVVRGGKKKPPQADYRAGPEESRLTGSGGASH